MDSYSGKGGVVAKRSLMTRAALFLFAVLFSISAASAGVTEETDSDSCYKLAGNRSEKPGDGIGTAFEEIDPEVTIPACEHAVKLDPNPKNMYRLGRALESDGEYEGAASLYRRSATQGFAAAQYNLSRLCSYGQGGTQSNSEAAKWCRKAADQAHQVAQYYLGILHATIALGEASSESEARRLLALAIQGEDSDVADAARLALD